MLVLLMALLFRNSFWSTQDSGWNSKFELALLMRGQVITLK